MLASQYDIGIQHGEIAEAYRAALESPVGVPGEPADARNARAHGMIEALDRVQCGALLIDGDGHVIQCNLAARRYMATLINVVHGQLIALDREANAALQILIRRLASRHDKDSLESAAVMLPSDGGHPVVACAVPLRSGGAEDGAGSAAGLVVLIDPNQEREPSDRVLRLAFGLTSAEIRLSVGLLKGMSLSQIARLHGLSVGTLRNQLKTVFAKTRTKRQSELTILLGRMSILQE